MTYQSRIHTYLSRHLRKVSGGGVAWHGRIFARACALDPQDLIDTAVDIAWRRLRVKPCTSPSLEINQEHGWIVFRLPVL